MKFAYSDIPDKMYFNPIPERPGEFQMTPFQMPGCVVFWKEDYAKREIWKEVEKSSILSDRLSKYQIENLKLKSEVAKAKVSAYNDAKKWNNAISAKFDEMIKESSKTLFGRIFEKPILERFKKRWVSLKMKKVN